MIRPLLLAIQFLTRLPTPALNDIRDREIASSQYYYPLAGLIIGLILALCSHFINLPSSFVEAALLLAIWVLLTGALHIDGLADCADAWVGGYGDKDKTLAIMKDPQSGPVAVTLVVCVLLIKFTALEVIVSSGAWQTIIIATVLSRSLLPLLFHTTQYVRENGLGSALAKHQSTPLLLLSLFASLTLAAWLIELKVIIAAITALIILLAVRYISLKRLGGITGDVAGAMLELAELFILIALISL